MMFNVELLTYLTVFAIFAYQVVLGLVGVVRKKDTLHTFQLFLFLFFLASELSRSYFPLFVKTLASGSSDKTLAMALPQIVWGLSALIATPYGWLLARKIGKKKVLMLSAVASAAALVATGMTDSYWVMLLCRSVVSIGYGIANIVAVIYLSNKGVKATVMSVLLCAIATSSICGNAIGGLLTSFLSYSEIFWISAASALLSLVVLQLSFREAVESTAERPKATYRKLFGNVKIQAFAILSTMPYRFVLTGFVLYLIPVVLTSHHLALRTVGQVMMAYFLLNFALVKPIAKLLDCFNNYRSIALLSTVITGIGLVMFNYGLNNLGAIYLSIAVISVGMSLNGSVQIPIVPIIFGKECDAFGRDTLLAYFRTVERVGSVLGPLLTAVLYRLYPGDVLTIIGVVLVVIAAALAVLFVVSSEVESQPKAFPAIQ